MSSWRDSNTLVFNIKDSLFKKIYFSDNPHIYRLYSYYNKLREINPKFNSHIDHQRKFIFIHNPKAAGTTMWKILKLPKNNIKNHFTPTFLVSPTIWEKYFTIVVIRNPLDRFISAYFELTDKNYNGYYFRKYPDIHSFTPRQCFERLRNGLFMTTPQYRYVRHFLSNKPVDYIIRFENLQDDTNRLGKTLNIKIPKKQVPHLNKRKYDKNIVLKDKKLVKDIKEYYHHDFALFGYSC